MLSNPRSSGCAGHSGRCSAYVSRRVGGDAPLAEDLVGTPGCARSTPAVGRGARRALAWLRVARNTLVSHFRRARPAPVDPATIDLEAPGFSPETPDTAAIVSWGLARLRRAHAEVLEAFYFDGKTVREIAGDRATSERAIEGRLRRARAKLRKTLERKLKPAPARREPAPGGRDDDARQTRTS